MKFKGKENGFTLMELLIALTVSLMLLAIATTLFGRAFATRSRESRRTDALTSAQAALNVMSREIGNSGYGLADNFGTRHNNGIVLADSGAQRIRVRANVVNINTHTADLGEDVTYYFDPSVNSIVRFDPVQVPSTTYIVNRISNVSFRYFDYTGSNSTPTESTTPSVNTGRVRITVTVQLDPVEGQPDNQTVTLTSDVTLRNSNYMLNQY